MRNYKKTEKYLNCLSNRGSHLGLSRVLELLGLLGSPQESLRIIHIAGTNGKGSVSAMLESILYAAGFKVGLFTSPCINKINEFFRVNLKEIDNTKLSEIVENIQELEQTMTEKPTEYEVLTAIALEFFRQENCDIVILETCMGGRLDATNIAEKPLLSVITDIALDHTQYLGNTISEIAYEKAGIIKHGCHTVFGGTHPDALMVIKKTVKLLNSNLTLVNRNNLRNIYYSLDGAVFDFNQYKNIKISLAGLYQPQNAAIVLTAIDILSDMGYHITEDAVKLGLKNVKWPGRFEILSKSPLIIYDGSHNPQGMKMTAKSIEQYFGNQKVNIVMGVMADKDYDKMVKIISPYINMAITVTPNNTRALNAIRLAECFSNNNISATAFKNISNALTEAIRISKQNDIPLLIIGTLYMYKDVVSGI